MIVENKRELAAGKHAAAPRLLYDCFLRRSKHRRAWTRLALMAAAPTILAAQSPNQPPASGPASPPGSTSTAVTHSGWSVTVGAGAMAGSLYRYMGSDESEVVLFPYIDIRWRDRLFVTPIQGVGVNLVARRRIHAGIATYFDPGRKEGDGDRLRGLGDIDPVPELRAFASYDASAVDIQATVRRRIGEGDGMLVELSAARGVTFSPRLMMRTGPSVTWMDSKYARAYFGISQAQAVSSGSLEFGPRAGVRDLGLTALVAYRLDSRWTLLGHLRALRLMGDAARSPVVARKENARLGTFLVYHF